jgi:5-hydroxyisourate hydrolase
MARLSTHVLDTARGVPARGVTISLARIRDGERHPMASAVTNADGRTDAPLLQGDRLEPGIYELVFRAGDYLKTTGAAVTDPPFLDEVVVRIGLADPMGNYHVPLLLSPFGYSTYRGS